MAEKKTNILVTMQFDENSDIRKQVNTEIDFKNKIIEDLQHLIKGREIKHFCVADDTVINEKLTADVVEREKIDKAIEEMKALANPENTILGFDEKMGLKTAMNILVRNIGE